MIIQWLITFLFNGFKFVVEDILFVDQLVEAIRQKQKFINFCLFFTGFSLNLLLKTNKFCQLDESCQTETITSEDLYRAFKGWQLKS